MARKSRGKSRGAVQLFNWRKARGLTQAQACSLLDSFQQSVFSALERGVRKPTRRAAVMIEKLAGVTVESWDEPAALRLGKTARDTLTDAEWKAGLGKVA